MKKSLLAMAAVVVLAGCAVETQAQSVDDGAVLVEDTVGQGFGSKDASKDVALTGVVVEDDFMGPKVQVQVTNNSEEPSDYWITVAAVVDGVRVDDTWVSIDHLAPGASAQDDASLWTDDRVTSGATFQIVEVERTASE